MVYLPGIAMFGVKILTTLWVVLVLISCKNNVQNDDVSEESSSDEIELSSEGFSSSNPGESSQDLSSSEEFSSSSHPMSSSLGKPISSFLSSSETFGSSSLSSSSPLNVSSSSQAFSSIDPSLSSSSLTMQSSIASSSISLSSSSSSSSSEMSSSGEIVLSSSNRDLLESRCNEVRDTIVPYKYYTINPVVDQKLLSVKNGTLEQDAQIALEENQNAKWQKWKFDRTSLESYMLMTAAMRPDWFVISGGEGPNLEDGKAGLGEVTLQKYNTWKRYRWVPQKDNCNYYRFVSTREEDKCLAIEDFSSDNPRLNVGLCEGNDKLVKFELKEWTPEPHQKASVPTKPRGMSGEWDLVFHDEFDDDVLDTTKWKYNYPGSFPNGGHTHNHGAYIIKEQVRLEEGKLIITAFNERHPDAPDGTEKWFKTPYNWISGAVHGKKIHSFNKVFIEGKCKAPASSGTWPALWTLNNSGEWPPEIDILEIVDDSNKKHHFYYHYTEASWYDEKGSHWDHEKSFGGTSTDGNKANDYHVYGVDWQESSMAFYYDGNRKGNYTGKKNVIKQAKNMFIIINLAISGWAKDPQWDAQFPAEYSCEWIRVWKRK